jgi:hypothetical protein
LKKGIGI